MSDVTGIPVVVEHPDSHLPETDSDNDMASQSPQRARQPRTQPITQGPPPREMSPSPNMRDRRGATKTHSMPLVSSVAQMSSSVSPNVPRQGQQSSPTVPHQQRRSPPLINAPLQPSKLPTHQQSASGDYDRSTTPPAVVHPYSRSQPPLIHAATHSGAPAQFGYPRPQRVPPPSFLTEQSWELTEQLMADIERADLEQKGVMGMAYAGSIPTTRDRPYKASDLNGPRTTDPQADRRSFEQQPGPRLRDPGAQPQYEDSSPSPQFHTPTGTTPNEPQVNSYAAQFKSQQKPDMLRRNSGASILTRAANEPLPATPDKPSAPSPARSFITRTPDKSLPVQEEPEDDGPGRSILHRDHPRDRSRSRSRDPSPTPSSDLHPEGRDSFRGDSRARHRQEIDSATLIDEESEDPRGRNGGRDISDDGEGSHTPRSPTRELRDDHSQHRVYLPSTQGPAPRSSLPPLPRSTLPVRSRTGMLDQLGLWGLDASAMDNPQIHRSHVNEIGEAPRYAPNHYQQQQAPYVDPLARYFTPHTDRPSTAGSEDPALAYYQAYLQSPRPDAPIPPTPHSQTAAPSPSPFVSHNGTPLPRQALGSPYPFPFSHVHRDRGYTNGPPSYQPPDGASTLDPNSLSQIEAMLAMQMQMYRQNNYAPMSDSTLSPSGTPFPPPGYNPLAFVQARRERGRLDSISSMRSSPSHEPIALPPPPPRKVKKRGNTRNLRDPQPPKALPPRVQSTQPRETSPEMPSSGEETAGEEHREVPIDDVDDVEVDEDENSEWIDEDEDDEEDLLDLEYHPSFVRNVEKRRRRWDARWDTLIEAFEALDRQTDTTLVLLASPSHTTKLHSITSRSIRRDSSLLNSPALKIIKHSFRKIATQRRVARSTKTNLTDCLISASGSSGAGSDGSSESREEDLRRALGMAVGTLRAVGDLYQEREARWGEEMRRASDDRERVELLLAQALGSRSPR